MHAIAARRPRAASPTARSTRRAPGAGGSPRPTSTDPARSAVLVDVALRVAHRTAATSSTRCYDPALSNSGDDDRGERGRRRARRVRRPQRERAGDRAGARARSRAATWARATAGPTCATTTGWTGRYDAAAQPGNVVQTARLPLTGAARPAARLTLALGFGGPRAGALGAAAAQRCARGFDAAAARATRAAGTTTSAASTRPRSAAGHRDDSTTSR